MDERGGCSTQKSRVVDTVKLYIYFQILFLFPLSSVVKWWSHCISEKTNQAQESKPSSVYKLFSFSLFARTLAFRQLDKEMGTSREQGLQSTHQRLSYVFVVFMQQMTNRFSPSNHLADGKVGQKEKRIEPQIRFSEEVLEMRCCDLVVLGLCIQALLPECSVLFLVHWAWWYREALAGRQGKRLGKHYRRVLWAHLVTETWQHRPKVRDNTSGQAY